MGHEDLLQRISATLGSTATVTSVFGQPIHASGRTVVPVAKVAYAFGGGGGTASRAEPQEGGGGGGAVRAFPAGALEITERGTRFIPFTNPLWLAAAFTVGAALAGLAVARYRR